MNPRYPEVAKRANHRCEYCHAPEDVFNFTFEVEHILPASAGGTASLNNLALACRSCNAFKGYRQSAVDPETGQRTQIFHPRQDQWEEHFTIDDATEMIGGLTATARTTIRPASNEQ